VSIIAGDHARIYLRRKFITASEIAAHIEAAAITAEVAPIVATVIVGARIFGLCRLVSGLLRRLRSACPEQRSDSATEQHAARNTNGCLGGAGQKAPALPPPRVLRTIPRPASRLNLSFCAILLRPSVVEKPPEQAPSPALGELLLEFMDAALGNLQRMFLHQDGLRHVVGRAGLSSDFPIDQLLRLGITLGCPAFDLGKPMEQAFNGAAIFGVQHLGSPVLNDRLDMGTNTHARNRFADRNRTRTQP
jgi:hypothetical protein